MLNKIINFSVDAMNNITTKYIAVNKFYFVYCNWFVIWFLIFYQKWNKTYSDELNFATDKLNFARCKKGTSEDVWNHSTLDNRYSRLYNSHGLGGEEGCNVHCRNFWGQGWGIRPRPSIGGFWWRVGVGFSWVYYPFPRYI